MLHRLPVGVVAGAVAPGRPARRGPATVRRPSGGRDQRAREQVRRRHGAEASAACILEEAEPDGTCSRWRHTLRGWSNSATRERLRPQSWNHGGMTAAPARSELERSPDPVDVQPVAVVVVVALAVWYWTAVRRTPRWPVRRQLAFAAGLGLFTWTTCGYFEVRTAARCTGTGRCSNWCCWGLVPLLPARAGGALHLQRPGSWVTRARGPRSSRVLANPLGRAGAGTDCRWRCSSGRCRAGRPSHSGRGLARAAGARRIGGLMLLPLVGPDDNAGSLAVGAALAIGAFELVLDAVPGHRAAAAHERRHRLLQPPSRRTADAAGVRDQQLAGNIVWCMAETHRPAVPAAGLPALVGPTAREAAGRRCRAHAERTPQRRRARAGRDQPWWLTDPAMQDRFRKRTRAEP